MELATDIIRFSHFLALSVGLGLAILLDVKILSEIQQPIKKGTVRLIDFLHDVIVKALLTLWFSGGLLILYKYDADLSALSAKVYAKFFVVTILTLNGFFISRFIIPIMVRNIGTSFSEVALGPRLIMSISAAVSSCSWFSALALGVFTVLKPLDANTFQILLGSIYASAMFGGVIFALMAPSLFPAQPTITPASKM